MAMQVPFSPTPLTSPGDTSRQYAQVNTPDQLTGVGSELSQLGAQQHEDMLKRQMLDINNSFYQEVNNRELQLQDAMTKAPPGASGFTQQMNDQFQQANQVLLQNYKDRNYSPEVLDQLQEKLQRANNALAERAWGFQKQSVLINAQTTADTASISLSQYASAHPEQIEDVVGQFKHTLDINPDLTEPDRQRIFNEKATMLRMSAGLGIATTHPQDVVSALDPQGIFSGGTPSSPGSSFEAWQSARTAQESGGDYTAVNPKTGAMGKYQIMPDTGQRLAAEVGISWRPDLMNSNSKEGRAYQDALSHLEDKKAWDAAGGDPRKASVYYYGGQNTLDAYNRDPGSQFEANNPKTKAYADAVDAKLKTLGAVAVPGTPATLTGETAPVGLQLSGKTGIPALDSLDEAQRLQVLSHAQTILERQNASIKAQVVNDTQNATAAAASGLPPAVTPNHDTLVRVLGKIEGDKAYANFVNAGQSATFGKVAATQSSAQIDAALQAFRPDPVKSGDHLIADLNAYEVMQKTADQIKQQRQQDPKLAMMSAFPALQQQFANAKTPADQKAAYVALQTAYQKVGIPDFQQAAFSPQEVPQLISKYQGLNTTQRMAQLDQWRQTIPEGMFNSTLAILSKHGATTDAMVSQIMHSSPAYAGTAAQVLDGIQAMRTDHSRSQDEGAIKGAFNTALGGAHLPMAPAVSNAFNEAAAALYTMKGGKSDKNGVANPALYTESLRQAVGGQPNNPDTGWYQMNQSHWGVSGGFGGGISITTPWSSTPMSGTPTILPPGITGTQFQNWIDRGGLKNYARISSTNSPAFTATGHPATWDDVSNHSTLVMVEPGKYKVFSNQDGKPLMGPNGQEYTLNISDRTVRGH